MYIKDIGKAYIPGTGKNIVFDELYLSRTEVGEYFPDAKVNIFKKYKIFINDDKVLLSLSNNLFGKIVFTLLFPVFCATDGYSESIKDVKDIWNNKFASSYEYSANSAEYSCLNLNLIYENAGRDIKRPKVDFFVKGF